MTLTRRFYFLALLLVFFALQLFQPEKTNPEKKGEITAPISVMEILSKSCYNCHSNATEWPWYSEISPISWWINSDVVNGREALNFSEWNTYTHLKQRAVLKEVLKETEEGDMPPWYYVLMHPSSNLKLEDRERIRAWVKNQTGTSPQNLVH